MIWLDMTWHERLPLLLLTVTLRYFIIAGVVFFIYYKWRRLFILQQPPVFLF